MVRRPRHDADDDADADADADDEDEDNNRDHHHYHYHHYRDNPDEDPSSTPILSRALSARKNTVTKLDILDNKGEATSGQDCQVRRTLPVRPIDGEQWSLERKGCGKRQTSLVS